jgi:hypothetical protein
MTETDATRVVVDVASRLDHHASSVPIADDLGWVPELVSVRARELLDGSMMRHTRE